MPLYVLEFGDGCDVVICYAKNKDEAKQKILKSYDEKKIMELFPDAFYGCIMADDEHRFGFRKSLELRLETILKEYDDAIVFHGGCQE